MALQQFARVFCLMIICTGCHSQQPGIAQPDVYDLLWNKNKAVAEQTLKLPFLQHMQSGDLQADFYVGFQIQDLNYVAKVTAILKEMCKKEHMPEDIRQFMNYMYKGYKEYTDAVLKQFNLRGVSDIKPIAAMEKYLSNYRAIMNGEEPIFFAVALLPCERLWIWIANNLKENNSNAYFTWKQGNMQGHPEDHYRKLLDKYLKTPQQIKKANEIFHQQMQNEHDFFAASL